MKQINTRVTFEPVHIEDLSEDEKEKAMESLTFVGENRDGTLKARACANGSTQRSYIAKEEAAYPTVSVDLVLITGILDAKQKRDVMTLDMPNAFVQTDVPNDNNHAIMKLRGRLVDIILEIDYNKHSPFVHETQKGKIIYMRVKKALYGMLLASIPYYQKFRSDVESIGHEVNPCDICVANKYIDKKQHTTCWHVDDIKSSHVDPKVNDKFAEWCEKKYGSLELGHVKVTRGKSHDYLGMTLDCSIPSKLQVDMRYYVDNMINEYPEKINKTKAPWNENLFKVNENNPPLSKSEAETFHSFTMKGMFLGKRGRPDTDIAYSFLSTRVRNPTLQDKLKLEKLLGNLLATREDILTLEADDKNNLHWYIDASFANHADVKSHTGSVFTLGKGGISCSSTKQKLNSRSTTKAELIGVDEKISKIIWTKKFIEHQGFKINLVIIYQDNTSTIKLTENGRASAGKRTRHFDIRLFYITDLIGRKEVTVKYCPTDEMIADYMSKPLVGKSFKTNRDKILNSHHLH